MAGAADPVILQPLPDYTLLETLYQGTRTTVYRGLATATQTPVIVKVLSREYPSLAELVQFRNQYTIAKNLEIPGIVRSLSLEPCGSGYGLVMEDVGGVDLGRYVQGSPLSLSDVLEIAIQLAETLHHLHQARVIHKDIKPANILIQPDSQQIALIDFSIASLLPKETQAIQSPNSLEGTLAYMAPEQTGRMNRAIDYRTDFYALGVTLYQLLTGQLPFRSDDTLELIHCHIAQLPTPVDRVDPEIPRAIAAIVTKLMQKKRRGSLSERAGFETRSRALSRPVARLQSDRRLCFGRARSRRSLPDSRKALRSRACCPGAFGSIRSGGLRQLGAGVGSGVGGNRQNRRH